MRSFLLQTKTTEVLVKFEFYICIDPFIDNTKKVITVIIGKFSDADMPIFSFIKFVQKEIINWK